MRGKMTFIGLSIAPAVGVIGAASMASAQQGGPDLGGSVQPCSLSGINPADHPVFSKIPKSPGTNMVSSGDRMAIGR